MFEQTLWMLFFKVPRRLVAHKSLTEECYPEIQFLATREH